MSKQEKLCRTCQISKDIEKFCRRRNTSDGYARSCKECVNQQRRARYRQNSGYFKGQAKKYYEKHSLEIKQKAMNRRMAAFLYYGNGKAECACCGVNEYEFLTIDHIVPVGTKGRTKLRHDGHNLYIRLASEGYPAGYRVLCYNCNCSRGFYGMCPHEISNGVRQNSQT